MSRVCETYGYPSETKPTFGVVSVVMRDML
ncbi:MAG: hypothetical protein JWR14_4965 [Caballeronia sp.]|jgi:hypothetical protein|nr:hypothetical protein [Caballeronia sp.]